MRALHTCLLLLSATSALADALDDSTPLSCKVLSGYDCLPGQASCGPIKRETAIEPVYLFNIAAKEVRSPFRTALLKIGHAAASGESLMVQGTDKAIAWSAIIRKDTGEFTLSLADRKGGYIAFGQCKRAISSAER